MPVRSSAKPQRVRSGAARQDDFRDGLVVAARRIVRDHGFKQLTIRRVAEEFGCSVGTIYNSVADFDDLVLRMNVETIVLLDAAMTPALCAPLQERPAAIVEAYFDFVASHDALWSALFEHHMPVETVLPDWYRAALDGVVARVCHGLAEGLPADRGQVVAHLVVALWAALHGLSGLGREDRLSTVVANSSARALGHLLVSNALKGAGWGAGAPP